MASPHAYKSEDEVARSWLEPLDVMSRARDLHPAAKVRILRKIADKANLLANDQQQQNEREGVPD